MLRYEYLKSHKFYLSRMEESNQLLSKKQTYKSKAKITLIILNLTLSNFYFGYTLLYFSQISIDEIIRIFNIENIEANTAKGILNGCIPVGALFGALGSSYLISKLSRRKCLLLLNLIAIVSGGLVYIPNFYTLLFSRFIQGFCVGAYSSIIPMMIKELSPTEISGTLGSYAQLLVCSGVFFGLLFKYILYKITGDETGKEFWYIIFGVTEVTVAIQTIVLLFVFPYQTPKYLLSVEKVHEARQLIQIIYKNQFVDDILQEKISDFSATETRKNVQVPQSNLRQEKQKTNKLSAIVAMHLGVLQQFSGINVATVYAVDIASQAIDGELKQLIGSLANFQQVLATFATGILLVKFGRKSILQFGTFFQGVANLLMAIGFFIKGDNEATGQALILLGLFLFLAVFGLSLGPLVWLIIAETVQPKIVPFATAANWIAGSLVIILFPILTNNVLDGNPAILFLFFQVWCFLSFFFNWKYLIETKDKTEKAIEEQYSAIKLF